MEVADTGQADYYKFAAHCLGYRCSEVTLNWYDVSHGYAQWIPPAILGGQHFEGVWHTGVVVFGKEYWYGGKVLASEPGKAPFPPGPVKQTRLGMTLRTREEFEDFLRFEMAPRYTRERYDVLRHNCNNFADEVVAFLIQGCRIPSEARLQPETVMSAPLLHAVRPYLNQWLGGFDAQGCDAIDDLMVEWRARLWPGDLALLVPQAQHHEPVRLVQVSNVDAWRGICDVTFFDSTGGYWDSVQRSPGCDVGVLRLGSCIHNGSFWDWQLKTHHAQSLLSLRPHTLGGKGLVGTSGAALIGDAKKSNPEIQRHLTRKAVVYAHCPHGHAMRPSPARRWDLASRASICGICQQTIPKQEARLECAACSFFLCNACDRKGLFHGYYSLGFIDLPTAKSIIQDVAWVQYKAQRYMAAAGVAGGTLNLNIWLRKVALRFYGDLGVAPPCESDLINLYRKFIKQSKGDGLDVNGFGNLLLHVLIKHSSVRLSLT